MISVRLKGAAEASGLLVDFPLAVLSFPEEETEDEPDFSFWFFELTCGTTSVVRSIQNHEMLSDVRFTGHDFLQVVFLF